MGTPFAVLEFRLSSASLVTVLLFPNFVEPKVIFLLSLTVVHPNPAMYFPPCRPPILLQLPRNAPALCQSGLHMIRKLFARFIPLENFTGFSGHRI